ncbi:MAG: urate hydroxylase PuuD [Planctomycetota bacterium]|nr:urate hydroxylase PuuD [Planctomycetota bacterium]
MDIDPRDFADSMTRWIHVVAGILWIGLLFFFNWVNSAFAPTMDAETKKKVVPELLPRTLYWFRWGAAFTWLSGVILLGLVYYMHEGAGKDPFQMFGAEGGWNAGGIAMIALTFVAVIGYDALYKTGFKKPPIGFLGGWALASVIVILFKVVGDFTFRAQAIHLGAMFGTFMAFNVWMRIWPAQRKIITAIKNGEKPDGDLAALAGLRSKHNTYMSVPLVFAMLSQHSTWAAPIGDDFNKTFLYLPAVILVGWLATYALYAQAKRVKGF